MRAEDQAIFGAVFEEIAAILPDTWEMSVGAMPKDIGITPRDQPNARFRGLAGDWRSDGSVVVYGPTPLAAASKLLAALRQQLGR